MVDRRGSRPGLTVKNTACQGCGKPLHFTDHQKSFGKALEAGLSRAQIRPHAPRCMNCMDITINTLIPKKEKSDG